MTFTPTDDERKDEEYMGHMVSKTYDEDGVVSVTVVVNPGHTLVLTDDPEHPITWVADDEVDD